jgi:hypothetical protein
VTGPSEKEGGLRTRKARAALAEAHRRARENPVPKDTIGVFVTRVPGGNLFGWEIRQFGGIVLEKGLGTFATSAEAQVDGERALADRLPETSEGRVP